MMRTLKLTVNETHTRLCLMPQERLDVRGDTIVRGQCQGTGRGPVGTRPSSKKSGRICREIGAMTT